jgi:hypothetical protein
MTADYSVSCDSEKYQFGYIWAVVMVFVYPIGCPLFYFYLLYDARHEIRTRIDDGIDPLESEATDSVPTTDDMRLRREKFLSLRFLYESYRPCYWWWELIETSQRLLLTGVLVVIGQGSAMQILVGALISLGYLYIFLRYEPFSDELISSVKVVSYWQIFFVFWIALLIKADFASIRSEHLAVCLIFVIFSNLIIDLWRISVLALSRWSERRRSQSSLRGAERAHPSSQGTASLGQEAENISASSRTEVGRVVSVNAQSVSTSPFHSSLSISPSDRLDNEL